MNRYKKLDGKATAATGRRLGFMTAKLQLSSVARLYVLLVVFAGALAIGQSTYSLLSCPPNRNWLVLAAFTVVSGTLTIKVPSIAATISVSEMFVFTAVILFGPAAATIIVALDGLIISVSSRSRTILRLLFNIAEPSVSIWIASSVFFALAGVQPLSTYTGVPASAYTDVPRIAALLLPLAVLATTYFLLNSWLMAIAIGFEKRESPFRLWRDHFVWLSLNYFGGASVAILLVRNSGRTVDPIGFAVILPLLLISYLTYKYSMGRVEDAAHHIEQLNLLHLSTINTLAMAIDAKDQITHGHIKRVQVYALGLAKALGVNDRKLLDAIQAAALLHDTGKLAVPEYILNKPGPLTAPEFEKMKVHAAVGADILSAIEFPYPVVPIVRHHHENWDGSGYPTGLKGPEIPIGARILAVVDCFDALTSDRPYRPRLPDSEALRILLERRGRMYDPLIVDTFLRVYAEIKTEEDDLQSQAARLNAIVRSSRPAHASVPHIDPADVRSDATERAARGTLWQRLASCTTLAAAADAVAVHLGQGLPTLVSVFYICDTSSQELVATCAVGPGAEAFLGLRMPIGQRISGWVAANRHTIVNSDPALDFGDSTNLGKTRLRSALSTPLIADGTLVGVLTVYGAAANAFSQEHRLAIETVAQHLSPIVRGSAEFKQTNATVASARGPLARGESEQINAEIPVSLEAPARPLSLLFIEVDHLRQIADRSGRVAADAVLRHVARFIRAVLREHDVVFRNAGDQFVVLLCQTDNSTAETIAHRIRTRVDNSPLVLSDGTALPIAITIIVATRSSDDIALSDLVASDQKLAPLIRVHIDSARRVH